MVKKTDREGISYHYHSKMLVVMDGDPLKKVVKNSGVIITSTISAERDFDLHVAQFRCIATYTLLPYHCVIENYSTLLLSLDQ